MSLSATEQRDWDAIVSSPELASLAKNGHVRRNVMSWAGFYGLWAVAMSLIALDAIYIVSRFS